MPDASEEEQIKLQKQLQQMEFEQKTRQESMEQEAKEADAILKGIISNHEQELATRDKEIQQLKERQAQQETTEKEAKVIIKDISPLVSLF